MDDLSGLDWSSSNAGSNPSKPPPMNPSASYYPALRPTPPPLGSGRNTPLSSQGSGAAAFKPPAQKPAQDSFSNLVNFGPAKTNANLTLRERQEQLEAEKRKKEEERRKQVQAAYGNGQFLDSLGSGSSAVSRAASPAIPPPIAQSAAAQNGQPTNSDDDLFAAFNSGTKVDNASHYPPPPASGKASPAVDLSKPGAWNGPAASSSGGFGDDDDPFGLNELKPQAKTTQSATLGDEEDDDLLGDLGKPVDQVRKKQPQSAPKFAQKPEPGKAIEDSDSDSDDADEEAPPSNDPFDKAVAQLVGYGFTPENARRGLTESGAGLNVQAAANWLLDDAHRQAKEKAKGKKGPTEQVRGDEERSSSRSRSAEPAWMQDDVLGERPNRRNNQSPATGDGDFTKTAAAMGTSFLKTANSLWKTGQKKVQKAVAEFQQEGGDPNQPKWMREAERSTQERPPRQADVTNEAMLLESGGRPGRKTTRSTPDTRPELRASSATSSRDQSPALPSRPGSTPKWQQQPSQPSPLDPRSRINKQAVEEQSSQAYVSPARRRKATPQPPTEERPAATPPPPPEEDLLFGSSATPSRAKQAPPTRSSQPSPAPSQPARQVAPPRPTPSPRPARQVPPISAVALQTSTRHRVDGTAHFKRGDYAAAHASYSSSLAAVPQSHPIAIIILTNRALTALKTGEPRQAVSDADTALGLIGPTKGEGEHVELGGTDNEKRDMRELYGKALTRKAEALEQMEKWADAGVVWQLCVESGVGGPAAIAGRQRCQKALAPKPAARPTPSPRPAAAAAKPRPRPAAPATQKSSDAVERLRAANKAAEKEGDEKLALIDQVDAKIAAWREGKRENLRALLGSLENVLWEGSGWKKVGLHELVVANKVKIIYMKAIAKTHPDKLPQDATTEIRMIAGTVFSTLNEAWDKFKAENGM